MYIGIAVALVLVSVLFHELGHALEMNRRGIKIQSVGIGMPLPFLTWRCKPFSGRMRNTVFALSPLIIAAYVKPVKKEEKKIKRLSYYGQASIDGAGVAANIVFSLILAAALAFWGTVPKFLTGRGASYCYAVACAFAIAAIVFWLGRNIFSVYFALPLGVLLAYVVVAVALKYGVHQAVGGPISIGYYIATISNAMDAIRVAANLSLGMGLINLLPLCPLDGGRIAAALLGKIHPDLGMAYRTLSTLAFLVLIGFVMLLGIK